MVGYITDNQTPESTDEGANTGYLQDTPSPQSGVDAAADMSGTRDLIMRGAISNAKSQAEIDSLQAGWQGKSNFDMSEVNDPDKMKPLPQESADYINNTYGPIGFDGKPVKITEGPVPDEVGKILGEAKKRQLDAQDTWRRFTGEHTGLTNFGVGTVGFMMDPLNAGSMFIPGLGEESALSGIGRMGFATDTMLARQGARVIAGASAGAAAQAPLTAIKYGISQEVQDDYSLRDAFKDMAYAATGNAIIHAGVFGSARELHLIRPDSLMMPKQIETPANPVVNPPTAETPASEAPAAALTPAPEQPYNIFTPEGQQISPSDKLSSIEKPEEMPDSSWKPSGAKVYDLDEAHAIINADAATKHAAMNSAASQLADGRPIDVADMFPSADKTGIDLGSVAEKQQDLARDGFAVGMTANELESATNELFGEKDAQAQKTETKPEDVYKDYLSQAQAVKDEVDNDTEHNDFDPNNLHHVQKALGLKQRPKSILNFIREKGGISLGKTPEELAEMKTNGKTLRESASGELRGIFDGDKYKNAFYSLVKKSGRGLDELAMMAREAGYFHDLTPESQGEGRGEDTLQGDDLLPLIEKELNGERHYTASTQQGIDEMFGPKGQRGEGPSMGELIGAEKSDSVETVARKLQEYYKPSEELAATHAADVEHTPPERAEQVADLMSKERDLIAEKQLPGEYDAIHETPKGETTSSEPTEIGGGSERDATETAGDPKSSEVGTVGSGSARKGAASSDGAGGTASDGSAIKPTAVDDEIAFLKDKLDTNKMTQDERQILADTEKEVRVAEAYRKGYEAAADCLVEEGA